MELIPHEGWEAFDRSDAVLDFLWSQLATNHWHYYNFTTGSAIWECRQEPAIQVLLEMQGEAISKLVIVQPERALTDLAWSRDLGGLVDRLVREFGMVVCPGDDPDNASDNGVM